MGMSQTEFNIDEVTESDLMGGRITFRGDNTFGGEIIYPQSPDKNTKIYGTYSVEDNSLTIKNEANNSTTTSKIKFEKDFMIATPTKDGAFISYYKRIE